VQRGKRRRNNRGALTLRRVPTYRISPSNTPSHHSKAGSKSFPKFGLRDRNAFLISFWAAAAIGLNDLDRLPSTPVGIVEQPREGLLPGSF